MKKIIYLTITCTLIAFVACRPRSADVENLTDTIDSAKAKETAFTSGYADVNGIRMYYEIHGEGKPLVLIHGGGSTIQTSFANILPGLSKNHKVIAVELQAHGRTGDRNTPISFEQDADDVTTLLDILDIDKADILGFSNGGNTTMQLAIRHPEIVDKIIIASAFYKRSGMFPGFWDFMKKGTINDMPQTLKKAFLDVTPDSARLQNLFEKCRDRMLQFKDWDASLLQSIQAPALIVAGDADVATPEHYVAMSRLIPHCQLMIIPGGHGKFMGESSFANTERNVESFVPLVEDFLQQ